MTTPKYHEFELPNTKTRLRIQVIQVSGNHIGIRAAFNENPEDPKSQWITRVITADSLDAPDPEK